ncbi:MAG TPA: TIGR02186 family protein [Patescibacteria group bacterium]|nr:TIGR02186 family protein [Patescibacteria group bacterium]
MLSPVRLRRAVRLAVCLLLIGAGTARAQGADPLVADLSNHLVAITTGFAGANVLLFGAVEGDGDVVVVVRGPSRPEVVRRRERILGIWINRAQATVADAPVYYRVAASRPLDQVAPAAVLGRHQIGIDHLDLHIKRYDKSVSDSDYLQALLRLKQRVGLYSAKPGLVNFVGGRLFRTEMDFPANVPTGTYIVEVYLMRGGEVASAQTTPLIISKTGIGAEVFDFANRQAALYGVMAILLAASAGWLAAIAFRRG